MLRALLISYHFPPARTAGAQRWADFTELAGERGWEFDVVSFCLDTSEHEFAKGVRVFGVPHPDHWFSQVRRFVHLIRLKLRDNFGRNGEQGRDGVAISNSVGEQIVRREDIRWELSLDCLRRTIYAYQYYTGILPWGRRAERAARALVETNRYDVVIASGPPHFAAEIARRVASKAGLPLIVDFRDPWAQIDMMQENTASPLALILAGRLERRVISAASLVAMNTALAEKVMRGSYPNTDFITVRNGYNGDPVLPRHSQQTFVAAYAGAIYLDRDPRPLLAAVAEVVKTLELQPTDFQLKFIGEVDSFGSVPLTHLADLAGVSQYVQVLPSLPKVNLHLELASAALLVNLPQGAHLCIPSKVYEYLHFPAWILAMEPEGTATRQLLESTGTDIVLPYDVSGIARVLQEKIAAFRTGVRPKPLAQADEFSARRQAEAFFCAVEHSVLRIPQPTSVNCTSFSQELAS